MTEFRVDPPTAADERTLLQGFLDYHRGTLRWKVSGLSGDQLVRRTADPSSMSLIGLVRHLGEVEQYWFHRALAGHDSPPKYWTAEHPDGDFDLVTPEQAERDLADYRAIVRRSDELAANYSLDDTFHRPGHDEPYSVRYLYIHLIEEYSRHNGHADLLRERLDGETGE
ncbi:putative damage-inducible protein DinB [Kribbella aluminosa]|uniref:Damage-inducible protein DinB n=1 Tax=Kribbella aluminosa TaxID=416017 RepID=A0ABS4UPS2_9ACTN|nr:DinB family protein [Kribbella aluminosa]MBP2353638.1 putative damage-inducible protein DinB [Kribbella aluminosa]